VLQGLRGAGVSSPCGRKGTPLKTNCGTTEPTTAGEPTASPTSRRNLLAGGLLAGASAAAGFSLFGSRLGSAGAAPSETQDAKIFNFALLLEYLQAGFYGDAVARGKLKGEVREFAETVAEHERDHVAYLRKALGPRARDRPRFDFRDATRDQRKFLQSAVLLENTGVAAYNGQAANLTKKALAAAAEIVSVEGRHAAWISDLAGIDPAPRAADPGASANAVVAIINRTGFIAT
jgi:rubrerythrin